MRKLDYLRKELKKCRKVSDVYFIKLPEGFRRRDDIEPPICIPGQRYVSDEEGMWTPAGFVISVEHTVPYEDGVETYHENFDLTPPFPVEF